MPKNNPLAGSSDNPLMLHFVGIGGIGISGLAQLCAQQGALISGSNQGQTTIWPLLQAITDQLFSEHKSDQVPPECDALIYSEAVSVDNVERVFAREHGIAEYSYFEYLGLVSAQFRTIAVAGTHGKTTTTGLIASGFDTTEFDATLLVGSTLEGLGGSNFGAGGNEWLCVEACEYRENFQFLSPEIVVLTNVEWDHADYFETEEAYFHAFERFLARAKTVIFNPEDEGSVRVLDSFTGTKVPLNPDFTPTLSLSGAHNRSNARLAQKLSEVLSLPSERFSEGLKKFVGAGRRQEYLGTVQEVQIFDDYGHHPTEIEVTMQAFAEKFPGQNIGLIFQPHQYSRTKALFSDFVAVLSALPFCGICPIYEARDTAEDKKNMPHTVLAHQVSGAQTIENQKDIEVFLRDHALEVLVFMGAGDISQMARDFVSSSSS